MRVVSLIVLVVCIALACAKKVLESRIISGKDAIEGQFPYQASLRSKFDNNHYCGAAILNNRFLLTAAHCCQNGQRHPKNTYAVVGALRQFSGGIEMDVDKITSHGSFDFNSAKNDIALIRTAKEIIFNDKIQPIVLPNSDVAYGKEVIISGWGTNEVIKYRKKIVQSMKFQRFYFFFFKLDSYFPSKPDVLQYLEVETISLDRCKRYYQFGPEQRRLHNSTVCTASKRRDGPCHGDSGMINKMMILPINRVKALSMMAFSIDFKQILNVQVVHWPI